MKLIFNEFQKQLPMKNFQSRVTIEKMIINCLKNKNFSTKLQSLSKIYQKEHKKFVLKMMDKKKNLYYISKYIDQQFKYVLRDKMF